MGRLDIGDVVNFETAVIPLITEISPPSAPLFPHFPRLAAVEIQASLPKDLAGKKNLTVKLIDRDGKNYNASVGLDPTREPMGVNLALSEIALPLAPIFDLIPDQYASLLNGGSCVLHSVKASGPMGDWKSWDLAMSTTLGFEKVRIPDDRGSVQDLNLTLDGQGSWPQFNGRASLQIGSAQTPTVPKPVRGIRVSDSSFSVNLLNRNMDVSGDWSIAEAHGGSFSGKYSYSSGSGYRIQGKNARIDTTALGVNLKGIWSGSFEASGSASSPKSPTVSVNLRGEQFRYKQFDLSQYPLVLEAKGRRLSEETFFLDQARLVWGPALQGALRNTEASRSAVNVEQLELGGDLNQLLRFLPPGKVPSGWQRWISPKGWKFRSGIRVGIEPDMRVEAIGAQLDLGNKQRANFNFAYSGKTGGWDFNTFPVTFNIAHLLKSLSVSRVEANGLLKVQADVSGNVRSSGGIRDSLVANVKGEVLQSTGRLRSKGTVNKNGDYLLGWRDLNGTFETAIDPLTKTVKADLRCQDWGWYLVGSRSFSKVGRAAVRVRAKQEGGSRYVIDEFSFIEGNNDAIRVDLTGVVDRQGDQWRPRLDLRFEARNSPPLQASPSMEIEGTAIFEATVRPVRSGNWILNGTFDGRGFELRVPARPVIMENLVGVIPIENIRLDEYFFKERWALRDHPFPIEPLGTDVVDRAFALSGSVAPNARMDRVLVDDDDYRNLVGRMVMIDDIFFINSFTGLLKEGEFPLKGTGFLFVRPGVGAGMRIRGYSSKVPLGVAVPGLGNLGVEHDAVKIDWYNYQEPGEIKIETRHLFFDIPVGKVLKKIPLLGNLFFGWTPDSMDAYEMTLQRKKGGKYRVLKKGDTGDIPRFPQFVMTTESYEAPPPEPDGGLWDGIKGTTQKVFGIGD